EIVRLVETAYQHLLNTLSTTGGLGMVANWEQQNFPDLLDAPANELADVLGDSLPASAYVNNEYTGQNRVIVLTPRSLLNQEPLHLKIIWLGQEPPKSLVLKYRAFGVLNWSEKSASHVARNVYQVHIPFAELPKDGVEYFAEAVDQTGNPVFAPANAPGAGWTAVVTKM
ncbi:hypothetical protein K8I31_07960, partial [bacterium]|nr:hypothetical protein [bacterium]